MNTLLAPFRIAYKIYFLLFFITSLAILYPFFKYFLAKKERFDKAFALKKFYGKLILFLAGISLDIKGKENLIHGQPFLICANHSSFLDPICLYALFDQYFIFTGKKEIEKWPLFHIFYTSGMNILVDRHNKMGALKSFKKMIEVVDEGHPLVILPEGTIPQSAPQLGEFKSGAVSIAIRKQIPILPITFTTNWERLQRKGLWTGKASPGKSEVYIHPIISTQGLNKKNTEELQQRLFDVINGPIIGKYGSFD